MAYFIIEEFSVRSAGESSRWARVLVDESGNVKYENVPGKDAIGRDCVSDYRHSGRTYNPGDVITTFCNYQTFTKYTVKAQNCKPFAYSESIGNSAECGYQVPLPTPGKPNNPFTNVPYKVFKFFTFCSENHNYRVNILKRKYNGPEIKINIGGKSPVVISYKNSDDNKFSPIRGCECKLTFISTENFSLAQFYTEDERAYRVQVLEDDEQIFLGYIVPGSCDEPFEAPPYPVSISATDGLGTLKNITYPVPIGSKIDLRQSFKDILLFALSQTNLDLPLYTVCNIYESKMFNGLNDDPLAQATVNPLRMADDKGNVFTCYQVIEEICRLFGAYIAQVNGAWHFVRLNELAWSVRRRKYNFEGIFQLAETVNAIKNVGNSFERDIVLLSDANLRIGDAYKRVPVLLKYGQSPAIIWNGDFEIWDGTNFTYWSRYGNISVSQIQNTIKNSNGQDVLLQDFRMQFNNRYDPYNAASANIFIQAADIIVSLNDKITLNFDLFRSEVVPSTTQQQHAVFFDAKIQLGEYYLVNRAYNEAFNAISPDGNKFEWTKTDTMCYILVAGAYGDQNTSLSYRVTLTLPDAPKNDLLKIKLHGFDESPYTGQEHTSGKMLGRKDFNQALYGIDNISISKSVPDPKIDGVLYMSDQFGYYTKSADQVEIIYGDTSELFVTNGASSQNILQQKLFAIYTTDNSYSTGWYEYGRNTEKLSIGMRLAKSILQAYQRPFRFFDASIKGDGLNYLSVFVVDKMQDKNFVLLSADFDLKYETVRGTMVEIFPKEIATVDNAIPHSPGQNLPPIAQDPNGTNNPEDDKIFFPQFTEQFT